MVHIAIMLVKFGPDEQGGLRRPKAVKRPMNAPRMPRTDSIEELARFWDTHDVTDSDEELEEVTEPVFERGTSMEVRLEPEEIDRVKQIAETQGLSNNDLIRKWILERIHL